MRFVYVVAALACAALLFGPRHAVAQALPEGFPDPASLLVLPATSEPAVDRLLEEMEAAYDAMDVDWWVSLFTEDVVQVDVLRRVHVEGREAWRAQTERINASHRSMSRVHHGRALVGDWLVVEIEWGGTVRGEALGTPGRDRSYDYSGLALLQLKDGKVRRQIIYGDIATLNEQLGLMK